MNWQDIAAASAVALSFLSWLSYTASILSKRTVPSQAAILTYALSAGCVLASAMALGAQGGLWLTASYFFFNIAGFCLALRYGNPAWHRFDKACIGAIAAALVLWALTSNPWHALLINIGVDAAGTFIVLHKLMRQPRSEAPAAWGISCASYFLNLLSLRVWAPQDYLFSLANAFLCAAVFAACFRKAPPDPCPETPAADAPETP